MRLLKGFKVSALVAMAVPALLVLTAITTFADASPARTPLPGDPNKGGTLYGQNCATCHGVNLEGNIGPGLNPIFKLPGLTDPPDPAFLIQIITNGRKHQAGDPGTVDMPAKGGNANLTPQDGRDVAASIIQQNQLPPGSAPVPPGGLAKRTVLWVFIGIAAMVFVTFLLAQYNMRWIARRAAARHK